MVKLTTSQKRLLTTFTAGAEALGNIVSPLSDAELDYSTAPGEWTIRQIVHHLADDGDAWSMPFKKAIATPGAPIRFEGFPGNEDWSAALACEKRPVQTALTLIRSHREHMSELAARFPDRWEQCVRIVDSDGHEVQAISAGQILRMLAEHLDEHIATIKAIKRLHGIQGSG